MSRAVTALGWTALILSVFYAMTAIVYSGCEPSYELALKPWPMWGWGYGGAEGDCYWETSHAGVAKPWWLSAPGLLYASMEDHHGGLLRTVYALGLLVTLFVVWPLLIILAAVGIVRRALNARAS